MVVDANYVVSIRCFLYMDVTEVAREYQPTDSVK